MAEEPEDPRRTILRAQALPVRGGQTDELDRFFELALDMLCIAGFDGYFKRLNPAWEKTLGLTQRELLRQPYLDFVHPADREATSAQAQKLTEGRDVVSFENRYRTRDGTYKWLLWNAAAELEQGIIYATARDVTERKSAEQRLAAEYAAARALAAPPRSGDTVLRILQGVCEALGWDWGAAWRVDPSEHVLRCLEVWHAPQMWDGEFELLSRSSAFPPGAGLPGRVWASGQPAWIPDVTQDLNFPRASLAGRQGLHGALAVPIQVAGEITSVIEFFSREIQKPDEALLQTIAAVGSHIGQVLERRKAEEALHESMEQVRLLLNSTAEAIYGVDLEGRCTFSNPAGARLLGYSDPGQLTGCRMHTLIHHSHADGRPYPLEECPLHQAQRAGEGIHADDDIFWRADRTCFPAEYWSHPIRRDGELVGAVVTFFDITKRRAVERMKNEFVSMVSHELRTPLTSIRGALGLLASGRLGPSPEKGQRMLEIALTNTDRLVRLINDILDIERIESGRVTMAKQSCDAGPLMVQAAEVMRPIAEKAGVILEARPQSARLWADPDRIVQTLTNLLSNAVKFSPQGATVWLSAERRDHEFLFQVRDEGRGIPPDKLEKIFERFEQVDASDSREKGGTGLGLAICRSIVQQHGGRIWVESTLGKGSSFFVALPLPESVDSVVATVPPGERTVLVCDDDPSIRPVVKALLEQRGYRVTTAASGQEAVERARAQPPAAILLDLLMPGMSGWEVIDALQNRTETRDLPVIIFSVLSPNQVESAPQAVAGWVRKPIDEPLLFQTLDKVLKGRQEPPQVLLVEDDDDLARVLVATFERHGIKILHAPSGREAIRLSGQLTPDLLVLDIALPEVDGFAVVDCLRQQQRLSRLPVVIYTVRDLGEMERERLKLGQTEFFAKGRISPEEFERRVVDLLNHIVSERGMEETRRGEANTAHRR
jgi:PAS domain S-box-containing protein